MPSFALPKSPYFLVSVADADGQVTQTIFQEVEGLSVEKETETVMEGGENRFVHQLPKPMSHQNLKLKRCLTQTDNPFITWVKDTIEDGFSQKIETKDLRVVLADASGTAMAAWSISNAYPVQWKIGGFDAMKDELAIDTVEFAFKELRRTI